MTRTFLLAVAVAVVASAAPSGARLYRNDAARVHSFEPPPGWQQSPQASYPRLLCAYTNADGGRLTLVWQKVAPGTTALALATAAAPNLEKQGFFEVRRTETEDRARIEAKLDGGRRFLSQIYLVNGSAGFVLSMTASTVNQPQMARDFESALRSLQITPEGDTH